jgi:diaminohydroxyphosphoribosylaminopyrimidine deaminase/5-amino-6-(5-phosphoribosylamino)uracil reductase
MQDPNPQVAGRGVHRLQAAGIEVECGVCSDEAESINRGFLKRMRHSLPFVTVKLAASVDGRTALGNGASQWITGEAARKDVQFERARSCAILTGADTVLADDPQLNVRLQKTELFSPEFGELDIRQPLVVIVDSKNRISPELTLFDSERTIIIANFEANPAFTTDKVCKANVIQWQLDTIGYHLNLQTLMRKLAEFGVNSVWCEAGERLSGAMLEAQLVDELIVYQAPKLMGPAAKPLVSTPDYSSMAEIPQFQFSKVEIIGDDIKLVLNQQSS